MIDKIKKNHIIKKEKNMLLHYHKLEDIRYKYDNLATFHKLTKHQTPRGQTSQEDRPEDFNDNLRSH